MKNLFTAYLAFTFLFLTLVPAQEKGLEEKAPAVEPAATDVKDLKIKFGSKEHRATVEEAPDRIESTENILWKTCLSLAAVIAIILIIFSVLKKVNGRLNNIGTDNPLRLNSKLVIDNKNYLALVRVYEEEILISVGPNGSTMLSKYALVDKEDAEGTDFESVLNREGQAVVPLSPENQVSSIDLKTIRELKSDEN
ncbi:MAG: flagellar biosynthetic protein FliO [Lentisphaeraceae bacterium]|nr:flagellar biosynthetic protein FliO [Lentisphaeraceae bacterium]